LEKCSKYQLVLGWANFGNYADESALLPTLAPRVISWGQAEFTWMVGWLDAELIDFTRGLTGC